MKNPFVDFILKDKMIKIWLKKKVFGNKNRKKTPSRCQTDFRLQYYSFFGKYGGFRLYFKEKYCKVGKIGLLLHHFCKWSRSSAG